MRLMRLVADPYPPYQYAAGGQVRGLDQVLIAGAFEAVGLRAETRLLTWSQCLEAMRDGTADAIFQITPTPERERWLAFSRPFRAARTLLYRRRDTIVPDAAPADFPTLAAELRVGVLEGFSYGSVVDAAPAALAAPSDDALLAALRDGVVDVAVLDQGVARHLLNGTRELVAVPGFCVTRALHLACRSEDRAFVDAFDSGLAAIRAQAR